MNILDKTFLSFWSWANNFPKKILVIFITILGLILIDSFFGFSYFYKVNNEINTLSKIQEIKQVEDQQITDFINNKKLEIINHKYLIDYVPINNNWKNYVNYNSIGLFIASNWVFLLMAIMLPFLAKGENIASTILIVELVLVILMTFIYGIVLLLPKFDSNLLNYIIIATVVPTVFFLLFSNGNEGKKS